MFFSDETLIAVQKAILADLVSQTAALHTIQTAEDSVLEKWQAMLGIVLATQTKAIKRLGLEDDQQSLSEFNHQLITRQVHVSELEQLNTEKWSLIFKHAFDIETVKACSLTEAQALVQAIHAAMTHDSFLKEVALAMHTIPTNASLVEKRQKLLTLLIPLHQTVMAKHGYDGPKGYFHAQKALLDHYDNELITRLATEAQAILFKHAGLVA